MESPESVPNLEENLFDKESGMADFERLINALGFRETEPMRRLIERLAQGEPLTEELYGEYQTHGEEISDQATDPDEATLVRLGKALCEAKLKYTAGLREKALDDLYDLQGTLASGDGLDQIIAELEAEISAVSNEIN